MDIRYPLSIRWLSQGTINRSLGIMWGILKKMAKIKKDSFPKRSQLRLALLQAVKYSGGVVQDSELAALIVDRLSLDPEILEVRSSSHPDSLFSTQVSFARSSCRSIGALDSPEAGQSSITYLGREILELPDHVAEQEIETLVKEYGSSRYFKRKAARYFARRAETEQAGETEETLERAVPANAYDHTEDRQEEARETEETREARDTRVTREPTETRETTTRETTFASSAVPSDTYRRQTEPEEARQMEETKETEEARETEETRETREKILASQSVPNDAYRRETEPEEAREPEETKETKETSETPFIGTTDTHRFTEETKETRGTSETRETEETREMAEAATPANARDQQEEHQEDHAEDSQEEASPQPTPPKQPSTQRRKEKMATINKDELPAKASLRLPALQVVVKLGGKARLTDAANALIDHLGLPKEVADLRYEEKSNEPVFRSRVGFAMSDLKLLGALDTPERGMFRITSLGKDILKMSEVEAIDKIRTMFRVTRNERERKLRESRLAKKAAKQAEEAAASEALEAAGVIDAPDAAAKEPAAAPAAATAAAPPAAAPAPAGTGSWQSALLNRLRGLDPAASEKFIADISRRSGTPLIDLIDEEKLGGVMLAQLLQGEQVGLRSVVEVDESYFEQL